MMRLFPEEMADSVTVQLGILVEEAHLEGLKLTCKATIPAYLGHHARHSDYADHRQHTINVEVLPGQAEPVVDNSCTSSGARELLPLLWLLILQAGSRIAALLPAA